MRTVVGIVAVLLLAGPIAAQTPEAEVGAVLDRFHAAASAGDFAAYFDLFEAESVFLGTDAWERWPRPDFEDFARPIFARGHGWTYASTGRHVTIGPDGRTAWFDEMLENANLGTTRGSGVLVRRDDGWRIAQYNLSLPVPNEIVDGVVDRIRTLRASQRAPANPVEALVDSIAAALVDSGRVAGMSVGVVHRGDTLVLEGYGLADLGYSIPTPPHGVYEIGSVTKQFTAAGILRLAEQGRLDLDADVSTYLPGFDTGGRSIPLRRMLDHTSGIQGYTEMEDGWALTTRPLPRDTLVSIIETWPFWHEPGEQMIYNNSAYFLLGLVIEAVSDTTYEAFLEQEFFDPLGMSDSRYCSNTAIVPRRMRGYDWRPTGLQRAAYLDHRWPYAAGSICSSVEDLLTWNRALHGGDVLGPEAYGALITPRPLADGSRIRYAAGVGVVEVAGRAAIRHGGGINGFLSDAAHFPGSGTTIVVLVNTTGPANPGDVTERIADLLFGAASPGTVPLDLDPSTLAGTWVGVDRGGEARYTVNEDGLALTLQRGPRSTSLAYRGDGWFASDDGGLRIGLVPGPDGRPRLHVDSGGGYSILRRAE